jgi:cold shock CspA family protein
MAKVMIFIDGSWLYANTPRLRDAFGQAEYAVNFGKLPAVLAKELGARVGTGEVDVVRTYLFGSYAANVDAIDDESAQRRSEFFHMLKEEFHYEVEVFPIDFRGRRMRRADRDPHDAFEPKEKCVDIALASTMLYLAALPHTYDIAIAVVGDRDFAPVLQYVRRLGKRVAIASIKGSCADALSDPRDPERVKDFDIIWLDDLLHELELRYERHKLACESPIHRGPREVWTTFHPRRGQRFYCPECQEEFRRQREQQRAEHAPTPGDSGVAKGSASVGSTQVGVVKAKKAERGYAFIGTEGLGDYYFHLTNLSGNMDWMSVVEGMRVRFEVKSPPTEGKAGAAENVRPHMSDA